MMMTALRARPRPVLINGSSFDAYAPDRSASGDVGAEPQTPTLLIILLDKGKNVSTAPEPPESSAARPAWWRRRPVVLAGAVALVVAVAVAAALAGGGGDSKGDG